MKSQISDTRLEAFSDFLRESEKSSNTLDTWERYMVKLYKIKCRRDKRAGGAVHSTQPPLFAFEKRLTIASAELP